MPSSAVSAAKLAANQANAQKSTGPTTGQGKATVARNAVKSGLCSAEVVLPGEDLDEFAIMKFDYLHQIKPLSGGIERTLFDELVAAAWKLRRAQRLETELLSISGDLLGQLDDDKLQKKFDNLARHRTRLERSFYRAMKELKALQTNRLEHNLAFDITEPLPGLADLKHFAKQTHARAQADSSVDTEPDDEKIVRKMQARLAELLAKEAA